jgi:hypothetical protein
MSDEQLPVPVQVTAHLPVVGHVTDEHACVPEQATWQSWVLSQ